MNTESKKQPPHRKIFPTLDVEIGEFVRFINLQ